MKGINHLKLGIIVGIIISYISYRQSGNIAGEDIALIMLASIVCAILPDIDTPESIFNQITVLPKYTISKVFKHRSKWTHGSPALIIIIVVSVFLQWKFNLNKYFSVSCISGFLSHIISDKLTTGVKRKITKVKKSKKYKKRSR